MIATSQVWLALCGGAGGIAVGVAFIVALAVIAGRSRR